MLYLGGYVEESLKLPCCPRSRRGVVQLSVCSKLEQARRGPGPAWLGQQGIRHVFIGQAQCDHHVIHVMKIYMCMHGIATSMGFIRSSLGIVAGVSSVIMSSSMSLDISWATQQPVIYWECHSNLSERRLLLATTILHKCKAHFLTSLVSCPLSAPGPTCALL